jgi:hypothetical protein
MGGEKISHSPNFIVYSNVKSQFFNPDESIKFYLSYLNEIFPVIFDS